MQNQDIYVIDPGGIPNWHSSTYDLVFPWMIPNRTEDSPLFKETDTSQQEFIHQKQGSLQLDQPNPPVSPQSASKARYRVHPGVHTCIRHDFKLA